MQCVKRSITLPKEAVRFVNSKARTVAKERGQQPNFSAALADIIIDARRAEQLKPQAKAA